MLSSRWLALLGVTDVLTIFDIFVNSFIGTPSKVDSPTTDPVLSSSETRNHGQMRFHEVTFVTAHNAHANNFAAGDNIARQLYSNQKYSIYHLLKYWGVRGLMLDIASDSDGIKLVHGQIAFNLLSDVLANEIIPFLDEDPDAIITIDFETVGDRTILGEQLQKELKQYPGFASRIFRMTSSRWRGHKDWPTIQDMRDSDQRVIILADSLVLEIDSLGIMWRNDIVMASENHWEGGLDTCTNRYGTTEAPWTTTKITGYRQWSRLFTMNHFCCATGVESSERTKTDLPGGGDNGWGILYPRVLMCVAANGQGFKPNFIAIDWAHLGDALEVADYLTIGGKIGGIGQSCYTGLDCATGSCSHRKRCQCQLCDANSVYCSGCNAGQSCVSIKQGENVCSSSTHSALRNSGVSDQKLSLFVITAAALIAVF